MHFYPSQQSKSALVGAPGSSEDPLHMISNMRTFSNNFSGVGPRSDDDTKTGTNMMFNPYFKTDRVH